MNAQLLEPAIQEFIDQNIGADVAKLAFQKNPFDGISWQEILKQIASKTKSKTKLPSFFEAKNMIYPSKISVEQTSSEVTAKYKSSLVSGDKLLDATGGFGIDSFFFSKTVSNVIHCEINPELSTIVRHNFKQLKAENIDCFAKDSLEFLEENNLFFDWIYIDPSRRNEHKGKVFMLADCLPNVPELQEIYWKYTHKLLLKTAPLLDIAAGLSELKNVKTIHIVAVNNEVKELLWEIEKDYTDFVKIKAINLGKNTPEFFEFEHTSHPISVLYKTPQKYLYEPNSAIMKSGGFDQVAAQFNLGKLHQNSHLYTSNEIIDFPGRVFEIQKQFGYQKNDIKTHLSGNKINVSTRNFPETVEQLRKKWRLSDGGTDYCFFTTDLNNAKIVLLCKKI